MWQMNEVLLSSTELPTVQRYESGMVAGESCKVFGTICGGRTKSRLGILSTFFLPVSSLVEFPIATYFLSHFCLDLLFKKKSPEGLL